MTPDQIIERLEPWLAKHRRPAWKPVVEDGDGPPTASKFCGTPWIGPDAAWPTCGNCNKPLQLFVQLNLGDLPEELGQRFGTGLLQLFYCTRDKCQGNGGWEPFADDLSRVLVVQPTGRRLNTSVPERELHFPAKRIVGWTRFIDLPMPDEHDELGLKYTYDFDAGTLRIECPELEFDITNPMNDCPEEEEEEDIATSEPGDNRPVGPSGYRT